MAEVISWYKGEEHQHSFLLSAKGTFPKIRGIVQCTFSSLGEKRGSELMIHVVKIMDMGKELLMVS